MTSSRLFVKAVFTFLLMACLISGKVMAQDDLDVISKGSKWLHYTDAPNALYHHLAGEAYEHLDRRAKMIAGFSALPQWQDRQRNIRETLDRIVGPFPERTPLNAKVVRVVEKDSYRVEHVVYESQPGFMVTSSLFIPKSLKRREKAPAVIYCSGHSNDGYRSQVYQHVILNLVKKGFIVFAFDPVGQGERLEYFDASRKKSAVGGPTSEHSYPGTQAFITGSSQARYMIWDGIRAVDYLLSRREIDPARIGITGRSGGGTQSSHIAAFDERIRAAAPECYITSFTRLLKSIGPQDAEQNFFHGISSGLDHADLLLVRAPKPALMITTTRDMFSIQGARETAKEVARIYQAYGEENNFGMVEDDAPHASTKKNREALYAFFQKHLDHPGSAKDEEVSLLSEAEIRVTPTGQLSTSLGGETVFSLHQKEAKEHLENLVQARTDLSGHLQRALAQAKVLSGYRASEDTPEPVFTGRIQRQGYSIEKYFIAGEGEYVVPYLIMVPDQPNNNTVLYLHPSGKTAEASPKGEMEWFVKNGFRVLAPDLPGVGELGSGDFKGDAFIGGISHNIWYASLLIGRSIVGVQAGDISRLVRLVNKSFPGGNVYGVARKEMTPVLLHAAAFIPDIKRVALVDPLISYQALVLNRFYHSPFIPAAVPGALRAYDLPDLAAMLSPRRLLMAPLTDNTPEAKDAKSSQEEVTVVRQKYTSDQAEAQLHIKDGMTDGNYDQIYGAWIK